MKDPELLFGRIHEVRTSLRIDGHEGGPLTVVSFRGSEGLSGVGAYSIGVACTPDTAETLDDLLGREAVFCVEHADDETSRRLVRGILEEVRPGGTAVGKNVRHVDFLLVPRMAELTHTQGCRVFQNVNVVEIARHLFKLWHVEVEPRLHPEPLKREYCTQVNERDFDFLARVLAEEGIHFHLEHGEEKTVVVLVNDPRGYGPIPGEVKLPYRDSAGAVTIDHVKSIRRERRVTEASAAYRDYNFLKPRSEMTAREETLTPDFSGTLTAREFYEYPGHYNDADEESVGVGEDVQRPTRSGVARARIRLEEKRSAALTFRGVSNSLRLRAGFRFEIADHPDPSFNLTYVVVEARVRGREGEDVNLTKGDRTAASEIEVDFVAVPADRRLRPRRLPKPKAHLRTAVVVGPRPDEPNVDEYGRIRIQFAWDREGMLDDKSSCWVRMATPVAHHNQGTYTAHRVGAEVLVDFLDGDVDRPVVVSALFNGDNRQPQQLPADATRAVLYRGLSVPGNKGKNEISCEDRAGKEEIFLHAQRDLNETILRSHSESIGASQSTSVGAAQSVSVGAAQSISVGANRSVSVKGNEDIAVTGSRTEKVGGGESVKVAGGRDHSVTSGNDTLVVAAGNRNVTASATYHLEANAIVELAKTTVDINAGTSVTLHHGGDASLVLKGGEATVTSVSKITLVTAGAQISMGGGKIAIVAANEVSISSGGANLKVSGRGAILGDAANLVSLGAGGSALNLEPDKASLGGPKADVVGASETVIGGALIRIG